MAEWRVAFDRSLTPAVRVTRREWNGLGDCFRTDWGLSLIRGGWFSQGLERFPDGWHFAVGPWCLWREWGFED